MPVPQHRLVKKVNNSLDVSFTCTPVPGDPTKLDCVVEFATVENLPPQPTDGADKKENSWFGSFWGNETSQLVDEPGHELLLLSGYVQLLGYVRLNQNIGSDGVPDHSVYWKNNDYLAKYTPKDEDEKVTGIMHTPFFRNYGGENPEKGRIGGVHDLNARLFDSTRSYLVHDLAFGFNTAPLPSANAPPLTEAQQQQLVSDLALCIVPFYVTAQRLLFSSVGLTLGSRQAHKMRILLPPDSLPPSYNTKLTGSAGDGGLVSIAYLFVVGFLENIDGEVKQRAVHFPIEFRPGKLAHDKDWLQSDYLSLTVVDKEWAPAFDIDAKGAKVAKSDRRSSRTELKIAQESNGAGDGDAENNGNAGENGTEDTKVNGASVEPTGSNGVELGNGTEVGNGDLSPGAEKYHKFVKDLDKLIESSVHTVATNERRKSSVSVAPDPSGLLQQVPGKPRVSYQIRVNNRSLCTATVSKSFYHVGEDVHFFLKLHGEGTGSTRVVGAVAHIEAHEVFHVEEVRKVVNKYKVTPSVKVNIYAGALADAYAHRGTSTVASVINVPRWLAQQFQASSLMDLKYFMVVRFVLNDFDDREDAAPIDADAKAYTDYIQGYKVESEATEFRFLLPLAILP